MFQTLTMRVGVVMQRTPFSAKQTSIKNNIKSIIISKVMPLLHFIVLHYFFNHRSLSKLEGAQNISRKSRQNTIIMHSVFFHSIMKSDRIILR